jgi:lysophospholipase L1-like esterase
VKSKGYLLVRIIFVLSLSFNIVLIGVIVQQKGGIRYLQGKLGIIRQEVPDHESHYLVKKSMHEILPVSEGAIVFIGNSLTENCDWAELFPDLKIQNRGIGGDWTHGILDRIDGIARSHPAKIFFEVGLGDLNDRPHEIGQIIGNCRQIVNRVKTVSPETRIYFQSLMPVQDVICRHMKKKSEEIIAFNLQLKNLSRECNATFIDLYPSFVVTGDQLNPEYTVDGGHVNGKGYLLWKSLIEKYVRE